MTDWTVVWLGVIAGGVVIMAAIQIGLIVVGLRVARQLAQTADEIRREVRPLAEKLNTLADEAARAASLATLQLERLDQILSSTTARVDESLNIVRHAMGGPVRQGYALALALRAAFAAFRRRQERNSRTRPAGTHEEDDALFVG